MVVSFFTPRPTVLVVLDAFLAVSREAGLGRMAARGGGSVAGTLAAQASTFWLARSVEEEGSEAGKSSKSEGLAEAEAALGEVGSTLPAASAEAVSRFSCCLYISAARLVYFCSIAWRRSE